MTGEKSSIEIIDRAKHWIESADELNKELFWLLFECWRRQNMKPGGFVNVALTIRALPDLIRTTQAIRTSIPNTTVRKFLRARRLVWLGDLRERRLLIRKRSGVIAAYRWYLSALLRSVGPLFRAALRRISGYDGLVEVWRRRRS